VKEVKAIIADDEAHLNQFLKSKLAEAWPELAVCGEAKNGQEAMDLIERYRPQIAFLDIRMPGMSGLQVADKIAGSCRVVFVTAFDQYAVDAFEKEAVDYLLKPVTIERLEKTVKRLQEALGTDSVVSPEIIHRLLRRLSTDEKPRHLQYVRAQHGDGVRLIHADEVIYFKAQDKYTLVITREGESLIRKSIKELAEELDPDRFWQIHRSAIVNVRSIARVGRSLTGKGVVKLKDRSETLAVSSRYMHLFKQM
jgi:DNA-binding LytR/AlgR family response regulator